MKATIDGRKATALKDEGRNGKNRSTRTIDNAQVQSSTVRDSPLAGGCSGFEASLPALLNVWTDNSFSSSTGPFGLNLKAAAACFRKYFTLDKWLEELR